MRYLPGLAIALAVLWFALSREQEPLYLALAAFSVLASLWLAARMDIIDRDASPYHRLLQVIAYCGWLAAEVAKSNLKVLRAIVGPGHDVAPGLAAAPILGRSDLARAMFANSITLTPGTVSVELTDSQVIVHALDVESASPEDFAVMDRRASRAAEPKAV